MQLAIYNQLKARISTLQSLKYVALWNNQFEREDINIPFNYYKFKNLFRTHSKCDKR